MDRYQDDFHKNDTCSDEGAGNHIVNSKEEQETREQMDQQEQRGNSVSGWSNKTGYQSYSTSNDADSRENYHAYRPQATNSHEGFYRNEQEYSDKKPKEKKGKEKKTSGFWGKIAASICLGLFFGLFAGVGFYGVQQLNSTGAGKEEVKDSNQPVISGQIENVTGNMDVDESKSGIKLTDVEDVRVVSSDVTDVVEEVMPAMVSIVNNYSTTTATIFGQTYKQEKAASGSGFIVAESDTELLIVTNHHVVEDAEKLSVTLIDGSVAQAQIKGLDSDMDLAVIAIPLESLTEETKTAIAIATLGDSASLKLGEPVVAIGNALGYGQSVTNGIVSALDREVKVEGGESNTFIQTNAAINPGNSGGALLNVNGEVIGINSNKIGATSVEGMCYAIPISAAKPIIEDLMLKETRTKLEEDEIGFMGISMQTISSDFSLVYNIPMGVFVLEVEEGSPAMEGGLLSKDIIVKFEGQKIESHQDLHAVLQYYRAGDTVDLTVKRLENGTYQDVEILITLGPRPKEN